MSQQPEDARTSGLRIWVRAVRAFSFTASATPVCVGAMLALASGCPVRWELLPLAAIGSILFHAGTNLVSDAADYERGVDRAGKHGGSGVLVSGLLTSRQVHWAGVLMFALGCVAGVFLIWARGLTVLWLGVAGLLGGFFYGGKSFGYRYHALGDVMVFLLMGPLIVVGTFYVLTGQLHLTALYVSLPIGCLVAAILSSNNLRDITHDSEVKVKTLANVIGLRAAGVFIIPAIA